MDMCREQAAAVEDFACLFEAAVATWPGSGNTQKQPSSHGSSPHVSLCVVHCIQCGSSANIAAVSSNPSADNGIVEQ